MTVSTAPVSRHLGRQLTRHCVFHQIEIQTGAETVWALLDDFNDWKSWNPLYVESAGALTEGNTIQFAVALPGMAPQRGKAKVLKLVSGEFVQYQITSLGGLVRAIRFVETRQIAPNRCHVINGEIMAGVLAPLFFKVFGPRVRQGLEGMNRALSARLGCDSVT